MGLRPTHRDESVFLRFIDSKRVTRDFRRSATTCQKLLGNGADLLVGALRSAHELVICSQIAVPEVVGQTGAMAESGTPEV